MDLTRNNNDQIRHIQLLKIAISYYKSGVVIDDFEHIKDNCIDKK
jgi:hypothetical protein